MLLQKQSVRRNTHIEFDPTRAGLEFAKSVREAPQNIKYPVFVGGPSEQENSPSSKFRLRIVEELSKLDFEVYKGEDRLLTNAQRDGNLNAQTMEMSFISRHCKSVILIGTSPGALCELGLFSWHFSSSENKWICRNNLVFFALMDGRYKKDKSYINAGPIQSLKDAGANVINISNFDTFEIGRVIQKLVRHRAQIAAEKHSFISFDAIKRRIVFTLRALFNRPFP